jgi:hypothetical protein
VPGWKSTGRLTFGKALRVRLRITPYSFSVLRLSRTIPPMLAVQLARSRWRLYCWYSRVPSSDS